MKPLQTIIDEVLKKLPESINKYCNKDYPEFKIYQTFSGRLDGDYFNICFIEWKKGKVEIKLAHTTDNPDYFVKMIKDIEPKAKVTYTITSRKEVTV